MKYLFLVTGIVFLIGGTLGWIREIDAFESLAVLVFGLVLLGIFCILHRLDAKPSQIKES